KINLCFLQDDLDKFKEYFPVFHKSSIQAFNNLIETYKHYTYPQHIYYQTLIDLMEISGYAYIYSVIYKKPDYWESVLSTWEEHFNPTKENIEIFARNFIYYRDNLFSVGVNFG